MKFEPDSSSTQLCEMNQIAAEDKINQLESQISELKEQNEMYMVGSTSWTICMSQLAEQISTLVTLASNGSPFESTSENTRTSCATVVGLPGESSRQCEPQSVEDAAISSDWERFESSNLPGPSANIAAVSEEIEEDESGNDEPVDETSEPIEEMNATQTEPKNESVADLLARMRDEGQWGGIPDEDSDEPTPIQPVEETATEAPIATGGEDTTDVEDYMSQLLSRMRGEKSPNQVRRLPLPSSNPSRKKSRPPLR